MRVSARVLGQDYGVTAEEMNRILVKQGFLKGTPGDYSVTAKAMQYAETKGFHRGTGGYACYNRYWTTRTYDESIKEVLEVTPELVSEVRSEIAAARLAKRMTQSVAKTHAGAGTVAKQATQMTVQETSKHILAQSEIAAVNLKKVGLWGLAIIGGCVIGYGLYEAKIWLDTYVAGDKAKSVQK